MPFSCKDLPNSLDFADIPNTVVEFVELNRHAADKFHVMTRDFGSRENSRVRDLVDLVVLIDNELLDSVKLRTAGTAEQIQAMFRALIEAGADTIVMIPFFGPHNPVLVDYANLTEPFRST